MIVVGVMLTVLAVVVRIREKIVCSLPSSLSQCHLHLHVLCGSHSSRQIGGHPMYCAVVVRRFERWQDTPLPAQDSTLVSKDRSKGALSMYTTVMTPNLHTRLPKVLLV